jgi:hypothetical protein
MGAAEDRDQHKKLDPETSERFTRIETLLAQVLGELRTKRRTKAKRTRSVAERSLALAEAYNPTEFEIAAARRALARKRRK